MADFFGYNFPFFSENSVLPPQADVRLIKNDVMQLLLTSPGERVMRPNFGTLIRKTPFDPLDNSTLAALRKSIRTALEVFEPRVIYRDVKFVTRPDSNYVEMIVFMALTRDPNVILNVVVNTAPGDPSQPQQGI